MIIYSRPNMGKAEFSSFFSSLPPAIPPRMYHYWLWGSLDQFYVLPRNVW